MIFAVPSDLSGRFTGMDIEIFGLASTSKIDMSAPTESGSQIWVLLVPNMDFTTQKRYYLK